MKKKREKNPEKSTPMLIVAAMGFSGSVSVLYFGGLNLSPPIIVAAMIGVWYFGRPLVGWFKSWREP